MRNHSTTSGNVFAARAASRGECKAMVVFLMAISVLLFATHAAAGPEDDGAEVLTRGPVHEAFAGVISYNPEPGVVVKKAPPELIEEIPPEEKPEGDDVAWIPGYWAWDDERDDYLWISGTWRSLPPGREWIAGYWREAGDGYQWISGYWADAEIRETTYLPPPPESLEVGPNIDPPSWDYGWTPGCWEWRQGRYVWRAGYWTPGRADWVWVPSYYIWTPRGFVFVPGYWDYVVERRGLLFAPVYYRSHGHIRRSYRYSPRIVISLSIFDDCLFLRPSYHHYYFGDYYDSRYDRSGFFVSFSFQSSRLGYDPFYSHRRWEHRDDRDWDHRYRESYRYRRENETARPPRTWSGEAGTVRTRAVAGGQSRTMLAEPIEQMAARKDGPMRFKPVAKEDRQTFSRRSREVQQSREERRTLEAKPAATAVRSGTETVEPARVAVPRSPIVGKPSAQRSRSDAPPERPQAPRLDPGSQSKTMPPGSRLNTEQRSAPGDVKPAARENREQPERRRDVSTEAREGTAPKPREEPPGKIREPGDRERQEPEKFLDQTKAQPPADERFKAAPVRVEPRKAEPVRNSSEPAESRRNEAAEAAARAQRQAEQRANPDEAATRANDEARKVRPVPGREQPDARPAREAPVKAEPATKARGKAVTDDEEEKKPKSRE